MISKLDIYVFVFVYNEELVIGDVLEVFCWSGYGYLYVIDDGSIDCIVVRVRVVGVILV